MIRVGSFRQRASLYATLNPFDSVFLILGRVVSAPGCSHPPSRAPPEGRTLATYLALPYRTLAESLFLLC